MNIHGVMYTFPRNWKLDELNLHSEAIMRTRLRYGIALSALLAAGVSAQQSGQPATDVLGSEDLWGNPSFLGGVTNGGAHGGSIW